MKEKILISSCLLGNKCKYNGDSNDLPNDIISALREKYELIPVCPETCGGLPMPRPPAERRGDRVVSESGRDVTAEFKLGAEKVLKIAQMNGVKRAILKERSPSCGSGMIYDGSFSRKIIPGDGVAAELLKKHGIEIIGESALV